MNIIKKGVGNTINSLKFAGFSIGVDITDENNIHKNYYNTLEIPTDGYTIYYMDGDDIRVQLIEDISSLISMFNVLTNNNLTTLEQVIDACHSNKDIIVLDKPQESLITDQLVYLLDFDKVYSYPKSGSTVYNISKNEPKRNHGSSKWICVRTDNAVSFSAIYPDTILYEDTGDTINEILAATNSTSTNITTISGNIYYADKPVHFLGELYNHSLIPLSLKGRLFGHLTTRSANPEFHIYCVGHDGTFEFYANVVGGITGTPTSIYNIKKGETISIIHNADALFYIKSDTDIVVSNNGGILDFTVVPPMSKIVYCRTANAHNYNSIGQSIAKTTSNLVMSDDYCFSMGIGDGGGSDSEHGLGLEYLSDSYSYGDTLSDFNIVAPYPNTTVTVSYYNNGWTLGETINLNGDFHNPGVAFREGTSGFGVEGNPTLDDGDALDLANGATLWKFEGNNPYYIGINTPLRDEESLYGWMTYDYIQDSILVNGGTYKENYLNLDGTNDHILCGTGITGSPLRLDTDRMTMGGWFRTTDTNTWSAFYSKRYSFGANNGGMSLFMNSGELKLLCETTDSGALTLNTGRIINDGIWHYLVTSYDGENMIVYVDGVNILSNPTSGSILHPEENILIGTAKEAGTISPSYYTDLDISLFHIYDKELTEEEVKYNYENYKTKFGHSNPLNDTLKFSLDISNKNSYIGEGTSVYDLANDLTPVGSLVNGILYDSHNGGSLVFDGTNDYLIFNNSNNTSFDIDTELTIMAWVNVNTHQSRGTVFTNSSYYTQVSSDGKIYIYTYRVNGASSSYSNSISALDIKQWYHICWTEDANGLRKIFINGVLDAQIQAEPTIRNSPQNLRLGGESETSRLLSGKIASAKLFSTDIGIDNILLDYRKTKHKFGHTGSINNVEVFIDADNEFCYTINDRQARNVIISDISGNDKDITSSGIEFRSMRNNNFYFDGITGFLNLASSIVFLDNTPFTVSFIFIPYDRTLSLNRYHILSGSGGNSMLIINNNSLNMWNQSGGSNNIVIPSLQNFIEGRQYHILVTRSSSNLVSFYVDGVLQGTGTRSGEFNWATIGRLGSSTSFTSNISLNYLKILSTELISTELNKEIFAVRNRTSIQFLLDKVTGASVAYSIRKLRSGYGGYCMKVRRSSDDKLKDIGFVFDEDYGFYILDLATLKEFIGTDSAFVHTFYSQGIDNKDMIQATNSAQPFIAINGDITFDNGLPAIYFNGTSQYLEATGVGTSNNHLFSWVYNRTKGYIYSASYNIADSIILFTNTSFWNSASNEQLSGTVQAIGTKHVIGHRSDGNMYLRENQTPSGTRVVSKILNNPTLNHQMGYAIPRNNTSEYYEGYFQEVIYYNTNKSADVTTIETDTNSFFNI